MWPFILVCQFALLLCDIYWQSRNLVFQFVDSVFLLLYHSLCVRRSCRPRASCFLLYWSFECWLFSHRLAASRSALASLRYACYRLEQPHINIGFFSRIGILVFSLSSATVKIGFQAHFANNKAQQTKVFYWRPNENSSINFSIVLSKFNEK